jgi:hypothetical protein
MKLRPTVRGDSLAQLLKKIIRVSSKSSAAEIRFPNHDLHATSRRTVALWGGDSRDIEVIPSLKRASFWNN